MPRVRVTFAPEHGSGIGPVEATTDDAGSYEALGVPACPLRATVDGCVVRFTVPQGVTELRYDIELLAGTISGHVYDADTRTPLAGVRVDASFAVDPWLDLSQAAARFVKSAITDSHGAFLLEGMPDGQYVLQACADDATSPACVFQVLLSPGGFAGGIDLCLQRAVDIDGIVLDPRGVPIAGATFTLRDGLSRSPVFLATLAVERSDASGKFRIHRVTPGEVLLTVHASGWANLTQALSVTAAGASVEARMSPEGRIRARVLDASGKPVPRADLVVRDAAGNPVDPSLSEFNDAALMQSDAQGYVTRGGLSSGHCTGEAASSAGRGPFECDVVEGQTTDVEIHVQEVK